jgi:hypothetical protein
VPTLDHPLMSQHSRDERGDETSGRVASRLLGSKHRLRSASRASSYEAKRVSKFKIDALTNHIASEIFSPGPYELAFRGILLLVCVYG